MQNLQYYFSLNDKTEIFSIFFGIIALTQVRSIVLFFWFFLGGRGGGVCLPFPSKYQCNHSLQINLVQRRIDDISVLLLIFEFLYLLNMTYDWWKEVPETPGVFQQCLSLWDRPRLTGIYRQRLWNSSDRYNPSSRDWRH